MKTKACRELDLFTLLADGRGRIYFFYLSSSLGKSLARDWIMSPEVDDITWSRWHHLRWMALLEVDDVTWVGWCHLSWMSLELDEVTWGDDIIWGRRYHLRWLVSPEVDDVTWGRWFHLKWTMSSEVDNITWSGRYHLPWAMSPEAAGVHITWFHLERVSNFQGASRPPFFFQTRSFILALAWLPILMQFHNFPYQPCHQHSPFNHVYIHMITWWQSTLILQP